MTVYPHVTLFVRSVAPVDESSGVVSVSVSVAIAVVVSVAVAVAVAIAIAVVVAVAVSVAVAIAIAIAVAVAVVVVASAASVVTVVVVIIVVIVPSSAAAIVVVIVIAHVADHVLQLCHALVHFVGCGVAACGWCVGIGVCRWRYVFFCLCDLLNVLPYLVAHVR